MGQNHFWVLGGDLRQAALASALAEDGHRVTAYALDQAELADRVERTDSLAGVEESTCVVLPLPVRGEGGRLSAPFCPRQQSLEEVLAAVRPGQFLCGGRVDSETQLLAERYDLTIRDYFRREELAVANAVPAALAV